MMNFSDIKLGNLFSDSLVIKKYVTLVINVLFLFSIFSSIFIPVLNAEDTLTLEKDATKQIDTLSVEKTAGTPATDDENDDEDYENDDEDDDDFKTDLSDDVKDDVKEEKEEKDTGVSYTPAVEKTADTPASSVLSSDSPANENYQSNKKSKKVFNFNDEIDIDEENTIKYLKSKIGNISKDQMVLAKTTKAQKEQSFSYEKTKIEKVEFKAASNQENVELSVKNLKQKPVEVKRNISLSNNSKIYEYLDIKLTANETYIGESGIESMNFTFTISKEWIQNESIDKHSVKMMRYHNDTWQELNTTYINETDEEIRFKAITPGLSVFAVVGNKVVEDTDEIIVETTDMPWWMPVSVIGASTAALGLVIFKKRFIYTR